MINKKLLFILIGVFFVASVCGVIFHFNSKNNYSMFGEKLDANTENNVIIGENNISEPDATPLDRDGAKTSTDTDSTTVSTTDTGNMGDALWEEAKGKDDTVIEASTTEEATVEDTQEEATVEDTTEDSSENASDVIGKFTVNNTGVEVRTGPKGTYDSLETLPVGATGEIVEVVNDYWVKIKYSDADAYICSKYAEIEMY